MKRKKIYDNDRQEPEPPRVQPPYSIERGVATTYRLMKGTRVVKNLTAFSEDGAHREAITFLKTSFFNPRGE